MTVLSSRTARSRRPRTRPPRYVGQRRMTRYDDRVLPPGVVPLYPRPPRERAVGRVVVAMPVLADPQATAVDLAAVLPPVDPWWHTSPSRELPIVEGR
ncbi:hypothetical protein [Micromonospora sp. WMMC273]|uniref:hypothetical protein n=1 Tax=Micromonospora sp. WMMC273 TaxID=3015157 RepID=UPI0022B6F266|nr:hypothetical protein [Micromonospora sp. WMMC273]MCZ7478850.1 hypothetical protein [Micromonospora sp. WMMC273]